MFNYTDKYVMQYVFMTFIIKKPKKCHENVKNIQVFEIFCIF